MILLNEVQAGLLSVQSLQITGGRVAIIGPNGSGKTTLLELVAGIAKPEIGTVLIMGKEPARCIIGWIGEFPDLNMTFNRVFDEIASPLRFTRHPSDLIEIKSRAIAERCGLTKLLDRSVRSLSGGEKVLVALAAALIAEPDLLILDETDSHFDALTMEVTEQVLEEVKPPHLLFATHRPDRIATADQVILLNTGMVVRSGTPDEVFCEEITSSPDSSLHHILYNPALWRAVYETDS